MKTILTGFTHKYQGIPVGLFSMTAPTTGLRCIRGIDSIHHRPDRFGLVPKEAFKLIISPSVQVNPVLFGGFPVADAVQVFNNNVASRSKFNDATTDNVVCISHETMFFARLPSQNTTYRPRIPLCLSGLKGRPCAEIAITDVVDMSAAEKELPRTIGYDGNVFDAAINTDCIAGNAGDRHSFLEGDNQISFAFTNIHASITECPFVDIFGQTRFTMKRDTFDASVDSHNGQAMSSKREVPTTTAALKLNSAAVPEPNRTFGYAFQFLERGIFSGDSSDGADRNLRGQTKSFPCFGVNKNMKPDWINDAPIIERNPTYQVAGIIPCLNRTRCDIKINVDLDTCGAN